MRDTRRSCPSTLLELVTSYTIWSKGRLLGRTTLDFCPSILTARMGWFEPTEIGERLMPALTYLGPFHEAITREMSDRSLPNGEPLAAARRKALARDALRYKTTEEAGAALDDLHLELRGPDNRVIPTDHISVQDTEYLMALSVDEEEIDDWQREVREELEPPDEFSASMIEMGLDDDFVMPDDWDSDEATAESFDWEESTLPRYQIFVELLDGATVPVSDRWKDDPYVQALVSGHDPFAERSGE